MAKHRVGVLERQEAPESSHPGTFCGQKIAELIVSRGQAKRIGKRLIHLLYGTAAEAVKLAKQARDLAQKAEDRIIQCFVDGPFGIGNLLPFFKRQNPQMQPEKLHYSMPMAGDGGQGLRRHGLRRTMVEGKGIFVSNRSSHRHSVFFPQVSLRRGAQIGADFMRTRLLTKANLPAAAVNVPSLRLGVSCPFAARPSGASSS